MIFKMGHLKFKECLFLIGNLFFLAEVHGDQTVQKDFVKKESFSLDIPFFSTSEAGSQKKITNRDCFKKWKMEEQEIARSSQNMSSWLNEGWGDERLPKTETQGTWASNQLIVLEKERSKYSPLSMAKKLKERK